MFAGSFTLYAAETVATPSSTSSSRSSRRAWFGGGAAAASACSTRSASTRSSGSTSRRTGKTRLRHAEYFLAVAESANLSSDRLPSEGQRHDIAIAEQDNIRAALAWALESGSVALGLQLATAIENFWVTHDPAEAMRWFAALLDHPGAGALPPEVRAPALRAYGSALYISGQAEPATRLWEQSLALFEQLGDVLGRAVLLTGWASALSSGASSSEHASSPRRATSSTCGRATRGAGS